MVIILFTIVFLPSCTKVEFDSFDPTTTAIKWIIQNDS